MDCGLPGFSVHGILQARILEWVAISFSRGSSWPRNLGLNPGLLHCRQILYRLSYEGSPGPFNRWAYWHVLFCHHCIGPGVIMKKKKKKQQQKNKKPNNNEWTTLKCLGISWETRNSDNLCPHSHMVPLCCSCHSSIPMPHHSPVPGNAVNHATCDEIFVFVFF